jgi:hypothetical protein
VLVETERSSGDPGAPDGFAAGREVLLEAGSGEASIFTDELAVGAAILAAGLGVECLTNLRQP